jgi:nicotinate-nucleotide pyrophosphorylase (carboxylating)
LIGEGAEGAGTLVQKGAGVVCGLPIVEMICRQYDERLEVELIGEVWDGTYSEGNGEPLMRVRGPLRSLLSAERVLLNFMQHLSGVATLTNRYVKRVEGTAAKIYDTRKTLPGFRALDKYAVRCGGGFNHRMGLYDGLLVKDNHLARVPVGELVGYLGPIVERTRGEDSGRMIEIEVDTLEQLKEVLKIDGVEMILLDNMDCRTMERAVEMRDQAGRRGRVELEASGGITIETVRAAALTGVDRIAIGAITHSAAALDIGMDVEE